ncbi:hemerythrin domain-containing protein [Actinomycetospora chiangmaiensis]|uniref:hemerythrin domain-containing protein n=1 Tax=Actinomycetospora chiangmaiensis TaxID=402650 RepID=UPI00038058EF|nr:hemerythrin domain-containing protein [Actinomycetospora chiangmaiensis]
MEPDPSLPRTPDDLLLFELGRRVLRRDVDRVADLVESLLAGTRHLDRRRWTEFAELVEELCEDLIGQLGFEEALLWPLLERHAPAALPYPTWRAGSESLRAAVAEARRSTRGVNADRAHRSAALSTADDHRRLGRLAALWRRLADGLEAFVAASTGPVIRAVSTQVPGEEWEAVLRRVREGLPDARSAGARVVEVATPDEVERLRGQLGPRPLAGWDRHGRRRRAREADLFRPS